MTIPFNPAAPPGYRQMGGGYETAIQQAQQQAGLVPQQQPQPQAGQMQLGGGGLPPQMMQPTAQQLGLENLSPLAHLQQINTQLPQQMQQVPQQMQQMQQMPQRFGDPPRPQNLQQAAAGQFVQQLPGNGLPPQQQIQAPVGIDLNTRLAGPNIPAQFQGRTLGEAIAMHQGLQQAHMQLMSTQAPSMQQPQQHQPVAANQPAAPAQPQGWDWKDPAGSVQRTVAPLLEDRFNKLEAAIAPVVQQGSTQAIQTAMQQAAAEIGPQFMQHSTAILQRLQGADPRGLTNPAVWKVAAESVIGAAALAAQRQPQQPQQQYMAPGAYPAQAVQPGQQPLPNLNSFFTEQPFQGGPSGAGGVQLTPQQLFVAQQMGISAADYAAWYMPTAGMGGQR